MSIQGIMVLIMLSVATLQIIAIVTMVIDHIGLYLVPDCWPLRLIGRLAFPIFAFLIVEGFKHTHSRVQYFSRLLICAIVSELLVFILASLTHVNYVHNILFLYALAIPALFCVKRGGFIMIFVPLFAFLAAGLQLDYGAFGMLLIVGVYIFDRFFDDNRVLRIVGQSLVIALTMGGLSMHNHWPIQCGAVLAIIPIALYSGKKGRRLPQFFRYAFYPAHLLLILMTKLAFY